MDWIMREAERRRAVVAVREEEIRTPMPAMPASLAAEEGMVVQFGGENILIKLLSSS